MDLREYFPDEEEAFRAILDSVRKRLWTALPVVVTTDTEDGHTVSVKSTIKGQKINEKGEVEFVDLPVFEKVPIRFSAGGGVTITHPVKKDDEGIIVFASRAIDNWHSKGGVQKPINTRMHDLSDGFYIPGVRSDKRKLEKYSKDSVQMRSDDGKHFVDLHPSKGTVTVSVDDGKHVSTIDKDAGITHKSSVKVHIEAPKMSSKGQWNHDGGLRATSTIQSDVGGIFPQVAAAPGSPPQVPES